jgi:large subunit ribosomal protein L17
MRKQSNLGRSAAHADALLMNLSKSLIQHKRINTTLAKGKALRRFLEPLLTKAKTDTTHSRRVVFSYFQDKEPVKELFNNIAPRIMDRPGGYLRVIRTGNRNGDNAETCLVEMVDYNTIYTAYDAESTKSKTRRGSKKKVEKAINLADTKAPLSNNPSDSELE